MNAETLNVAVVGSGPSGAYASLQLLASSDLRVQVDLFDRLATPWGLVRAGVAPDHPKIKNVTRVFERLAEDPRFAFLGNVEIGRDVSPQELSRHYDAVLLAVGAASDRRLGVPGEDLGGSHPATDFVAWYNGHPDHVDDQFDLKSRRVVVVGNGNVALDVARILALTPTELSTTDIADHALEQLAASSVEEIVVLGRRGPLQAAFTNPEIRELAELADAEPVVDPRDLMLDAASQSLLETGAADTTSRMNLQVLRGFTQPRLDKTKRIILRFGVSPVEFTGDAGRINAVRVVRNVIETNDEGRLVATPTAAVETIQSGLVLRAVGYRGRPLPGVPFDAKGSVICNDSGRVVDPTSGAPIPGLYTAGWIKRGATGVIGTNKRCAHETVERLIDDARGGRLPKPTGSPAQVRRLLLDRGVHVVGFDGWQAIDRYEQGRGSLRGRPRIKLVRHQELLREANSPPPSTRGG